MLPVALNDVVYRARNGFELVVERLEFPQSAHTAIAGTPAAGSSTLLKLIAGELTPQSGDVTIGNRVVNRVAQRRRPILFVTGDLEVPGRWAVDHALVAALRDRTLDRVDRQREFQLAVERWELGGIATRRIDSLSSSERALVHIARIELMRPAILLADRLLSRLSPALRHRIADELFRSLRVSATTVISVPSDHAELAFSDRVVVLDRGRVIQSGTASEVYGAPADERAAIATGTVNEVPIEIRGSVVESPIGSWSVEPPPFQGTGVALVRPDHFVLAGPGEESDFVFSIEEAGFGGGRWLARGFITGGLTLRVDLPRDVPIRKGRLIPLRIETAGLTLVPRAMKAMPQTGVPTDIIPSMRDTR